MRAVYIQALGIAHGAARVAVCCGISVGVSCFGYLFARSCVRWYLPVRVCRASQFKGMGRGDS